MLYLVRGLPGSGKSTLAYSMLTDYYYKGETWHADAHFEADMYHMVRGVYQFKGENVKLAHEWCFNNTRVFLHNKMSVAVSNTFTKYSEMENYLQLAETMNVPYKVIRCVGNYGNTHNVPENVLQNMKERMVDFPGEILYNEYVV